MKAAKWYQYGVSGIRRALALALLLALLPGLLPAGAEGAMPDMDLLLAKNAVAGFGFKDADGKLLEPRKAEDMRGRGVPDVVGEEPDYRGVVGYVSLQTSWDVTRFNTFARTPWQLPVYAPEGDDWKIVDTIKHKTPVLIVDQQITEGKAHRYYGYLHAVRLDINRQIWIDVTQFITVPYWTLELGEALQYGYCIARYRDATRDEPTDRKGHRGTLPESTRILMCDKISARYRKAGKLLGIVFRSTDEKDSYYRTFLFFNPEDLTMIY